MSEIDHVIIIDDSISDQDLIRYSIVKNKILVEVTYICDGEEAISKLLSSDEFDLRSIKVILLDLNLPKVNGLNVLRELKNSPNTRNIPVCVFTTSSREEDIKKAYLLNANSYVVKPSEFHSFSKTVNTIFMFYLEVNQISTKLD
jgi:CheY-like chemotaxis protein